MKFFKLLLLIALCCTAVAETQTPVTPQDLSGTWKVMLENSYHRKLITFRITQKDGRLRGKMLSKDSGSQEIDGRQTPEGEVLFWSTFSSREGATMESTFTGRMEEDGAIVGRSRFFGKPYDFRAERAD